jgi:hypothetical protein
MNFFLRLIHKVNTLAQSYYENNLALGSLAVTEIKLSENFCVSPEHKSSLKSATPKILCYLRAKGFCPDYGIEVTSFVSVNPG